MPVAAVAVVEPLPPLPLKAAAAAEALNALLAPRSSCCMQSEARGGVTMLIALPSGATQEGVQGIPPMSTSTLALELAALRKKGPTKSSEMPPRRPLPPPMKVRVVGPERCNCSGGGGGDDEDDEVALALLEEAAQVASEMAAREAALALARSDARCMSEIPTGATAARLDAC